MVIANFLSPDTYHAPYIEGNDTDSNSAQHRFSIDTPSLLNLPVGVDAKALPRQGDHVHLRKLYGVEIQDLGLQCLNDDDGSIECITQQEESYSIASAGSTSVSCATHR